MLAGVWVLAGCLCALAMLHTTRRTRPVDPLPGLLLAVSVALLGRGPRGGPRGRRLPVVRRHPPPARLPGPRRRRHRLPAGPHPARPRQPARRAGRHRRRGPGRLAVDHRARPASTRTRTCPPCWWPAPTRSGYLLVLGVAARLGFAVTGARDGAARLLLAGAAHRDRLRGRRGRHRHEPGWRSAGSPAFALLLARGAPPRDGRSGAGHRPRPGCSTTWRFVVPARAGLPGARRCWSLTHPSGGVAVKAVIVLGGAILLFVLALLRIVSLLVRLRRTLHREHVLRGATGLAGRRGRPRRRPRRRPSTQPSSCSTSRPAAPGASTATRAAPSRRPRTTPRSPRSSTPPSWRSFPDHGAGHRRARRPVAAARDARRARAPTSSSWSRCRPAARPARPPSSRSSSRRRRARPSRPCSRWPRR